MSGRALLSEAAESRTPYWHQHSIKPHLVLSSSLRASPPFKRPNPKFPHRRRQTPHFAYRALTRRARGKEVGVCVTLLLSPHRTAVRDWRSENRKKRQRDQGGVPKSAKRWEQCKYGHRSICTPHRHALVQKLNVRSCFFASACPM